ncbi:MAG: response regulator transcription factor [Sedimenticola sp.]|uniref:Response regulator transcription factor n=1 Tax=Sedimenticola thiotaurini TaxID=1543721 RepID=A0A558DAF0_9GAMM|nr:response regulator transcription factor [Sedimenticola sp.]TVT58007.1 MAG: response regulator transcription factor [Sedimenticola thiotaurini]MCW8882477.1 response regulator transcription factor [Sedimenticola sp.]MCW8946112.1 response regulator transcription factor [Sedimenticola sp.]MCW8974243.1 response regulator transcription factor [Sedimenticola sp.]
MRLLLVEDDAELVARLKPALKREGFAVDVASNGVDAEFMGDEEPYDVVVLDLGLPQRPGLEVLANWRARKNSVPVLVLTARDAWHERVDGFKAGADDYLGKPFHVEELVARLIALVRRSVGQPANEMVQGGLRLDEMHQQVILPEGKAIDLTGTEFRLLRYFMLHPGQILSKSRLTEHVYDQDFDRDSNLIEVYIRRLRERIGKTRIETRRGQGYLFKEEAE